MAGRLAKEEQLLSRQKIIYGDAYLIRANPTQKNTTSGIRVPAHLKNRIQMRTIDRSEKVDVIRAPPVEKLVDLPPGIKFPVCPKHPIQFCTTKLSQKLYKTGPSFDLDDPQLHLMKTTYNNLHDPHLKQYYNRKKIKQRLFDGGFITSDDQVICTLKEYNQYREYLSSLHRKEMKIMLEKQDSVQSNGIPKISERKRFY
ncbi:Hypothetical predicted protein [Pelobates cultripes]|uniref:Uncharacterized protein n=1 Tax=Pelobates cultripes TaxID=61616 RepID=A0AAD1VMV8_PELCU|nr:Hypothetical predicted protein [Pelobates cultripes]